MTEEEYLASIAAEAIFGGENFTVLPNHPPNKLSHDAEYSVLIGSGLTLDTSYTMKYGDPDNNVTVFPDGSVQIVGDPTVALQAVRLCLGGR